MVLVGKRAETKKRGNWNVPGAMRILRHIAHKAHPLSLVLHFDEPVPNMEQLVCIEVAIVTAIAG